MDLGALLKTFIYLLASSLLYPVLVLLSLLVLWAVVHAGGFFGEWLERRRLAGCPPQELPARLREGRAGPALSPRVRDYLQRLADLLADPVASEAQVENLLQESTLALWRSLDKLKILIRVGPGLGLIGTLIPMSTGLAGLSQGDLTRLSADLVVAFTTTVVGLALGMAAYFFFTIEHRWLQEDAKNMELATEVMAGPRFVDTEESILNELSKQSSSLS